MITPMDSAGRWWLVNGHEIDLNAPIGTYPRNVRAAALTKRDAESPEEQDLAALLEWLLEAHPPWTGECAHCGRDCGDHSRVGRLVTEWLFAKSQEIYQRITARLDRLEAERKGAA